MQVFRLTKAICAISLLLVSGVTAAAPGDATFVSRLDEFVLAEMRNQKVPGLAVAIVRNGEVIAAKGYGSANVEHGIPVTRSTMFQSGSVGKMFTATAVMLEVERGRLALDNSILDYLPDAPSSWRPITVRHLLTHTSGIPDYSPKQIDYRRDYSEDELAKLAYQMPLEFAAGERWNYSNTAYVLLGIMVRRVSGRFYGDVLKEEVFTPLGMKTARNISEADIVPHRAAGYRLADGELKNQDWVSPALNTTADGSLYLSIDDMIAWERGVRTGAVLSAASWKEIYSPVHLNSGKTYPYGFAWSIEQAAGRPRYHHGGSWQGFKAYFSRYLAGDLSIIILANLAEASPARFVDGIARLCDPKLVQAPPARLKRDPAAEARLRFLLDAAAGGRLKAEDVPLARQGFVEQAGPSLAQLLGPLGKLQRLQLVDRTELGDDQIFTYDAAYPDRVVRVRLGLAPGDRTSLFDVEGE